MSAAAFDNDNKLFRRGIRHDFVNMLLHDLKLAQDVEQAQMLQQSTETEVESTKAAQVPTLTITTQILRDVEEMTNFLTAIDIWENEVLDKFLMIKRYIPKGHQNKDYIEEMFGKLNAIFEDIKKLKEEVPEIITIPAKEAPEVGKSSITVNQINDKHVESEIAESANAGKNKNDKPIELENFLRELDSKQKNCLYSLAIFPENTELKKRLLVHWCMCLGDKISIMENGEKLISKLEKNGILIPERIREHNGAVDSYTIDPRIHKLMISKYKGDKCTLSDNIEEENFLHLYKHGKDDEVKALLNVNQKQVSSKHISRSPTIKVAQIGMWRYPDWKGHNDINEDNIEADETEFLENMAKTVTYLSLKGISRIYHLPESIGNMNDLMVLDLKDCHNLQRLPEKPKPTFRVPLSRDNQWFKELRHLDITGCHLLYHMPKWICELSNLLVLKGAVFNGFIPDQCQLHDISKLQNLIKLSIKVMHSHFFSPEDFSGLASLSGLRILRIVWGIHDFETIDTEMQRRDNLSIPKTGGEKIPSVNEDEINVNDGMGSEQRPGVNEDQITVRGKESSANACKIVNIFRSTGKKSGGLNNDKMLETEKQMEKAFSFSFPENLEKLDIICYPFVEAPKLLNAAKLKKLKRLYIRGGMLAKIDDDGGWQVEILRLRFLNNLVFDWYELGSMFPRLRCVNYEHCERLKNFPRNWKNRSLWIKEEDGPFPSYDGPFNDDEEIFHSQGLPNEPGRINMNITCDNVAPCSESKFNAILEFQIQGNAGDSNYESRNRPGLDIVAVLDASGNMEEEKLAKLKTAVQLLISKLSSIDRFSIVTFGTKAKRQCGLRQVTEYSQKELQYLIESFEATGHTNTFDGYLMGLKILKDRRLSEKRAAAIILVSGGLQTIHFANATHLPIANVPVYAFGLGKGYDTKELESIAHKSLGGSFEDIQDMNVLNSAFFVCLEKLVKYSEDLYSFEEDLTVTISPVEKQSTIEQVFVDGGQNKHSLGDADGSRTFKFDNIRSENVRIKMSVNLLLHAIKKRRLADVLHVEYTHRFSGQIYEAPPLILSVRRVTDMMAQEKTNLKNACAKIVSTPNLLDDVKKQQLIGYLESLDLEEIYQKLGRVFVRALKDAKVHGTRKFTISAPLLLDLCQQVYKFVPLSDSYYCSQLEEFDC